jgi:hypothetical protein
MLVPIALLILLIVNPLITLAIDLQLSRGRMEWLKTSLDSWLQDTPYSFVRQSSKVGLIVVLMSSFVIAGVSQVVPAKQPENLVAIALIVLCAGYYMFFKGKPDRM